MRVAPSAVQDVVVKYIPKYGLIAQSRILAGLAYMNPKTNFAHSEIPESVKCGYREMASHYLLREYFLAVISVTQLLSQWSL